MFTFLFLFLTEGCSLNYVNYVGTPDPIKAKDWGPVCSIWPVDALHYAFFSAGNLSLSRYMCIYMYIYTSYHSLSHSVTRSLSLPLSLSLGEKVFWNDQWGTAESKRDQIFWHNRQKMAKFLNTDVQLTVDEGLEQALIEGREVLFTSNIADSYVFSSPDMALTILIKDSVEKKVGSNKVFTDISRFH
jgi:hypothetical protein